MNSVEVFSNHPFLFLLLIAWSLAWKGVALWKAAQNKELKWFVALLIVNTAGLLEIIYIYCFSKRKGSDKQ